MASLSGNCSGEICDSPLACATSSRTAPFVDDAEVAGKARRALGPHLHRVRRLRERAQGRLHLHLQRELVLLRLVELDDQPAVRGVGDRLDVPGQHLVALHARDFARAAQQQRHAAQFALHDLEIQQRHLAHQAGADADLRQHLGGVEQFAFGLGPRLFPGQFHRAVRRQEAGEVAAFALGPGRARELELRVRAQPLQDDRLQHARAQRGSQRPSRFRSGARRR